MATLTLNVEHNEYLSPFKLGPIKFSESTALSYVQLLTREGTAELIRQDGFVDDKSLPAWLSPPIASSCEPIGTGSDLASTRSESSGGLKLLYGNCSFDASTGHYLNLTESSFRLVESHLGIPASFLSIIVDRGSRAFKHTSRAVDGTSRTCYIFKFGLFTYRSQFLALTHNHATHTTTAILLRAAVFSEKNALPSMIDSVLKDITSMTSTISHPMLLPACMTDVILTSHNSEVNTCDLQLSTLEEVLGQHEYTNLKQGDPLTADLVAALRKLNSISRVLAGEALRLACFLLTIEKMAEYAKVLGHEAGNDNEVGTEQSLKMGEYLAYLKNACQVTLKRAEYMVTRKDSLLQVVYQFMTQKNANVNIALAQDTSTLARASKEDSEVMRIIAIESKRDGTSMKTISILGMLFLPGTFLATIFAMPVFDWDNEHGHVFKPAFRYYLALCLPLTVIIILTWMLATGLPWKRWLAKVSSSQRVVKES